MYVVCFFTTFKSDSQRAGTHKHARRTRVTPFGHNSDNEHGRNLMCSSYMIMNIMVTFSDVLYGLHTVDAVTERHKVITNRYSQTEVLIVPYSVYYPYALPTDLWLIFILF